MNLYARRKDEITIDDINRLKEEGLYPERTLDNVNHPSHYEDLLEDYECIDAMVLLFGKEQTISFCRLNAFKYIFRHEKKNGKEDLDKAEWYLHKIEELEEEKKNG